MCPHCRQNAPVVYRGLMAYCTACGQPRTPAEAVYALAAHRGGVLAAADVARSLSMGEAEADALLTAMAKEQPDWVTLDVDDDGRITYRFANAAWDSRIRVDAARQPR